MMSWYRAMALKWKIMMPFALLTILWAATGSFLLTRAAIERATSRTDSELQQKMRSAGAVFADQVAQQIELARLAANTEGVAEALIQDDHEHLERLITPLLANSRTSGILVVGPEGREVMALWKMLDGVSRVTVGLNEETLKGLTDPPAGSDKGVVLGDTPMGAMLMSSGPVRVEDQRLGTMVVMTSAQMARLRMQDGGGDRLAIYGPKGNEVTSEENLPQLSEEVVTAAGTARLAVGEDEVLVGSVIARGEVVAKVAIYQTGSSLADEVSQAAGSILLLGIVAVLGVLGMGALIARSITRPLERVAQTASMIAAGDLDKRAKVRSGDEIGTLGAAFNQMADNLHASHVELEQRVRARTEELENANTELERLAKAKSEFLANMSHELRTPLNAILGYSEILADPFFGSASPADVRKQARAIHQSGKHLLNLINDVLDLSKIEAGKLILHPEETDARDEIKDALRLVEPMAAAKEIRLRTRISRSIGPVRLDPKRFRQILLNLLSNAVKFTPEGGAVTVEAHMDSDELIVTVADTGIGIAPEDQENVFEQFRQIDGSYARTQEGTGLGLALTRQLVQLHGGEITLSSEVGKGSRFTVTIPNRVRKMRRAS